jgi:hypothetical protein
MAATVNADPPRTSNRQRILAFLPLIIPVAVVLTFAGFYRGFLLCSEKHPCSPFTAGEILSAVTSTDPTPVVAIYVARASWTLINGVHLLACVLAITTASIVIYRVLSEDNKKVQWVIIPLVIAASLNIALLVSLLAAQDVWSPAQQLFRGTIGGTISWINKFNRFIEAFSLTGTLSLAVAACAILWQPDPNQPMSEKQLMLRVRLLRPVLYVGAATLVMSVLRLAATHAWAVSYLLPDTEPGKSIVTLTTGIVGSLGTTYTLLIAGIYLPAALILRERLKKLPSAEADPESFLATRGLSPTLTRVLPRVIALIGPLLAGPLGDALVKVINSLGGAS